MASKKTTPPETRQFTVNFIMADPVDKSISDWIDATVEATGAKPVILIKAAIHHGSAEAGRRATERYEKLKSIDGQMFDMPQPAAAAQPAPPAPAETTGDKLLDALKGTHPCRTCAQPIKEGGAAWWHPTRKTYECVPCHDKAAAAAA